MRGSSYTQFSMLCVCSPTKGALLNELKRLRREGNGEPPISPHSRDIRSLRGTRAVAASVAAAVWT